MIDAWKLKRGKENVFTVEPQLRYSSRVGEQPVPTLYLATFGMDKTDYHGDVEERIVSIGQVYTVEEVDEIIASLVRWRLSLVMNDAAAERDAENMVSQLKNATAKR